MKELAIGLIGRTVGISEKWRRLHAFARLRSSISGGLDSTVVALGRVDVHGTGNIRMGPGVFLYSDVHLETRGDGSIDIGRNALLNRGVHVVSMAKITIGEGTMIGEYTSLRDANHARVPGKQLRNSGHIAKPITIGREVWIGRGVTILPGVTIGDGATVGANAVVTKNVPQEATVAGVPARLLGHPSQ